MAADDGWFSLTNGEFVVTQEMLDCFEKNGYIIGRCVICDNVSFSAAYNVVGIAKKKTGLLCFLLFACLTACESF